MEWILIAVVVALVLLGVTYWFRGREALERARQDRVTGRAKGTENTLPSDFTDMSG
jgi:uncharacterized membrane protein YqiK